MELHEIPSLTTAEIINIGERVAASTNQFVSPANPILSAALPTGERIQIVLPPAAPDGGTLSIRKQVISDFTLDDYRDQGSLDQVAIAVGGLSEADQALIDQLSARNIYGFIRTAMTAEHKFKMPFLLTPEEAARRIVRALRRKVKVYDFPWQTALMMKFLTRVPDWLLVPIVNRIMKPPPGEG